MADIRRRRPPQGLQKEGLKLWRDVAKTHDLREDEIRLLERACRVLDTLAGLDTALDGADLILEGSRGQAIANPLLTERRLHEETLGRLLRQIGLQDEDAEPGSAGFSDSHKARRAAMARWNRKTG